MSELKNKMRNSKSWKETASEFGARTPEEEDRLFKKLGSPKNITELKKSADMFPGESLVTTPAKPGASIPLGPKDGPVEVDFRSKKSMFGPAIEPEIVQPSTELVTTKARPPLIDSKPVPPETKALPAAETKPGTLSRVGKFLKTGKGPGLVGAAAAGIYGIYEWLSGDEEEAPVAPGSTTSSIPPAAPEEEEESLPEMPTAEARKFIPIAGIFKEAEATAVAAENKNEEEYQTSVMSALSKLDVAQDELEQVDRDFFSEKRRLLKQAYEEKSRKAEWSEVAEMLAHAITQLGAGYYGLKNGVDLSGLKFSKRDWESKYDRMFKEYGIDLDLVEGDESKAGRDADKENARRQEQVRRRVDKLLSEAKSKKDAKSRQIDLGRKAALYEAEDVVESGKVAQSNKDQEYRAAMKKYEDATKIYIEKMKLEGKAGKRKADQASKDYKERVQLDTAWYGALSGDKYSDKNRSTVKATLRNQYPNLNDDQLDDIIDMGPAAGREALSSSKSSPTRYTDESTGDIYEYIGGPKNDPKSWKKI